MDYLSSNVYLLKVVFIYWLVDIWVVVFYIFGDFDLILDCVCD